MNVIDQQHGDGWTAINGDCVESLQGLRAIIYTSPRHTTASPRWRVILPLLSPIPPKKVRPLVQLLSDGLFPGYEGAINVEDYLMKPKQVRTVSAMTQNQALAECARIIGEDESEDAESGAA